MYSVTNLTTIADLMCVNYGKQRKSRFSVQKLSEERLVTNYSTTSVEIDAILQGVIAEIAAVDSILAVLPNGPTKDSEEKKQSTLEYKNFIRTEKKLWYLVALFLEKN